jgi:hypothetical protein
LLLQSAVLRFDPENILHKQIWLIHQAPWIGQVLPLGGLEHCKSAPGFLKVILSAVQNNIRYVIIIFWRVEKPQ